MTQKTISTLIIIFLFSNTAGAQKLVIDTVAINHWAHINGAKLSPDGNYVYYAITDSLNRSHSFIQSTTAKWKEEISGDCQFTGDDKELVQLANDSLFVGPIRSAKRKFIARTQSFKLLKNKKKEFLLFTSGNQGAQILNIYDLSNGKEWKLENIKDYFFKGDISEVNNLLVAQMSPDTSVKNVSLSLFDFVTGNTKKIWEGNWCGGVAFDGQCKQIAFIAEEGTGNSRYVIYVYNTITGNSKKIVNAHIDDLPDLVIDQRTGLTFNKDGSVLLFRLKDRIIQNQTRSILNQNMNIWNYQDIVLPVDRKQGSSKKTYLAIVHIQTGKVFQIEKENDKPSYWYIDNFNERSSCIIYQTYSDTLVNTKCRVYLFSLINGSKEFVREIGGAKGWIIGLLSLDDNYALFYEPSIKRYYTYEVATHKTHDFDVPDCSFLSIAGWLDDKHVLIQDLYTDIWRIDLSAQEQPRNLTLGYAKANKIDFHLLRDESGSNEKGKIKITNLHLAALDKETKKEGFYLLDLTGNSPPKMLYMNDYHFSGLHKAKDGDSWLVERQRADEAANYFITKDFKSFRQITDVQPQRKYNWLTSELIKWKANDTTELSGVLYKPENFDSTKKYPVIFYYYEVLSDELNFYPEPELSTGKMNIPWFVSRGYVVCTPDIKYSFGHPGLSSLNAVESAAKYLMQFPWVDSKRMGLQGHSFGGYETNYIITHSHLFAAAVESAGVSDIISDYLGRRGDLIGDNIPYHEAGQGRMTGTSLWENKQQYLDESPVFNADKVTTPLLIMHNKKDEAVSWQQGIELFSALWRLGKPCWMLQYDDGGHDLQGLLNSKEVLDYTIRMTQFFDHYLKDAPAPKWMTAKGDERYTGYELNTDTNQ